MIRLYLVDDHEVFLSGLRSELNESFDIVGWAVDVETAKRDVVRLKPDVVLLDVHLPNGGGAAVLTGTREVGDDVKFLALSVSDAPADVIAVIRAGARGYVTKTISPSELVGAVERVHEGDAVFSPRLAGFVLDAFREEEPRDDSDPEFDLLTPREQDVLRQIARGFAYKQVARNLNMSVKTVETHMTSVLRKLQLSSRHELAAWANRNKIT
jgi:DNA-binding NarL/FixJ family response regulator